LTQKKQFDILENVERKKSTKCQI